jgi:hypothetical protein
MNAYDGMEKILELTDIIDKLEQVLQIVINYGVREQEEVIEKIIKEYEEDKNNLINRMQDVSLDFE